MDRYEKDINENIILWYNAPIFRLAYIYCLNNTKGAIKIANIHIKYYNSIYKKKIKLLKSSTNSLTLIFDIAIEIIGRINKDNQQILPRRYKDYCNKAKDRELSETEGLRQMLKRIN